MMSQDPISFLSTNYAVFKLIKSIASCLTCAKHQIQYARSCLCSIKGELLEMCATEPNNFVVVQPVEY